MDVYYFEQITEALLKDIINHAATIKFDRMPDHSWQRIASDKPIQWLFSNTDKIISASASRKQHTLKDELNYWEDDSHMEVAIELRVDTTTYLFSAEIRNEYSNKIPI